YTTFAMYNYQMFQASICCKVNGNVIRPNQPSVVLTEGRRNVTLSCNYSGNVRNLQWYRQYPGSKPENIIFYTESSNQSEPKLRLYAVADKGIKRMNLSIYSTELDDSALYYCALEPTVTGNTTALYKNRQSGHTVITKHYQNVPLCTIR
uniref:T-cell receptor alpha/delta variable 3.0.1 n=1 Tax=Cyprinus carpio TaxID=7962 RepID=A0A8C1PM02_CYPCA